MEIRPLNAWARGIGTAALIGSAGNWSGPAVWALAITAGASFFDLGRRDRVERGNHTPNPGTADPFTPEIYGVAMQLAFLAVLCIGAWDNRGPEIAWRHPGPAGVVGFVMIMAGVALRQRAAQALGRHFTVGLSLFDDHELIVGGPYRWLRHPNYAALLLIALGTAMMVRSPRAAGVALVLWLPLALLRIAKEESALHARLGSAYGEYTRGRWCLMPGVY